MNDPLQNVQIVDTEEVALKTYKKLRILPWLYSLIILLLACVPLAFFYGEIKGKREYISLIGETSVLKTKANDLEKEIITLKNYSVLIDALALNGGASRSFVKGFYLGPDTIIDTLNRIIVLDTTKEKR